jgi:hypothetical protein
MSGVPTHGVPMTGVAATLARFEGRMLLRHPGTVFGVLFLVLMTVANLGSPWEADAYSVLGGLGAATLGPFALLASNGAWQRSRRDGAGDLLSTLPALAVARAVGHLWSVTAAVVLAATATATALLVSRLGGVDLSRWPTVPELVQGPLAVGCAGILGAALARRLPWRGVAGAAAVGVVAWQLSASWLGPLATLPLADSEGRIVGLSTGSAWWHLLWLGGWAGLGIAAVLLDRRRHLAAAGAAGLLVLVLAGVAQLP